MFSILLHMHKVTHEQGAIHTLQDSFNEVNFDAE